MKYWLFIINLNDNTRILDYALGDSNNKLKLKNH